MTMFLKRIAVLMLVLVTVLTSTVLTDLSVEAASAATKETVFYQLPGQAPRDAGDVVQHMSYVFKTVNGKIIVIDGGNYAGDGPYLYSFLQKITGKTKPHVDAWFITHPHSDHYGALNWIYDNKLNNITVDTFYYNFPSQEQVNTYCVASAQGYTNRYIATIESWFTFFKNSGGEASNIVKVRAIHNNKVTSTFDIDDVHIEVLLTYHDVFWGADNISTVYNGTATSNGKAYTNQTIKTLLANDFVNNLSTVFQVTVGGQKVLFLGDAAEAEGKLLVRLHDIGYWNLKSDIVQMAHHGQNGIAKDVYERIAPTVCLWPTPAWVYDNTSSLNTRYTRDWMNALGVKYHYIAKDGMKAIYFPLATSADGSTLTYNVEFDSNGGTGIRHGHSVVRNTDSIEFGAPTHNGNIARSGCTFSHWVSYAEGLGWCTSSGWEKTIASTLSNGKTLQVIGTGNAGSGKSMVHGGMLMTYAVWKAKTPTFSVNYANASTSNVDVVFNWTKIPNVSSYTLNVSNTSKGTVQKLNATTNSITVSLDKTCNYSVTLDAANSYVQPSTNENIGILTSAATTVSSSVLSLPNKIIPYAESELSVSNATLTNIPLSSSVESVRAQLNSGEEMGFFSANGASLGETALLGTGCVIKLERDGVLLDTVTAKVLGDNNGDGLLNSEDVINLKAHLKGITALEGIYLEVSDYVGDGTYSSYNYIRMKLAAKQN